MRTKLAEYLSLRDVPLALGYSTLWFVGLWVVEYPVYDSLGIIILAYITLWASRLAFSHSLNFLAQRLNRAVSRAADELGIEMPDETDDTRQYERARFDYSCRALNLHDCRNAGRVLRVASCCSIANGTAIPRRRLHHSGIGVASFGIGGSWGILHTCLHAAVKAPSVD